MRSSRLSASPTRKRGVMASGFAQPCSRTAVVVMCAVSERLVTEAFLKCEWKVCVSILATKPRNGTEYPPGVTTMRLLPSPQRNLNGYDRRTTKIYMGLVLPNTRLKLAHSKANLDRNT